MTKCNIWCGSYDVGGDDRRILLWDVERALSDAGSPAVMKGEHHSNVFCVAFNNSNTKVFSGGKQYVGHYSIPSLGRLRKVDLIILEGKNVCPSVRPSVRPSVHKKFLQFE